MHNSRESPYIDIEFVSAMYATGHFTIKQLAQIQGVSAGKLYYAMRDSGCKFTRAWKKTESPESWKRRSLAHRGRKLSENTKRIIGEKNSCNYNGLNGFGHVKNHNRGYTRVYVPMHPHAAADGYVMFHTVLMEQKLGRYLNDDEVVHHINHNRKDNRIENLRLMKKKEHMSMHMKERHAKE